MVSYWFIYTAISAELYFHAVHNVHVLQKNVIQAKIMQWCVEFVAGKPEP